ncbi:putative N-carbamoylsarcosine amidase [Gymnopus androsaceus JB14]|uniref:N-carbamoylsarcosine amidase n=1 Tax=Gymnopus androsaceus JB14 TaxID=1447944 RepID=A0A6A4GV66_9AGAR|nr:putative N-carbamoylsarcosine amidase [Gymnopus androsaceus JB14]
MSVAHSSFEDYQRAGFSNVMGWGTKPALIVIDVCKAYWSPGSPLDLSHNLTAAAAPDSMRKLVAAAREGKVPVLWSEVRYLHPEMLDAGLFYKKSKALAVWQKGDARGSLEPAPSDIIVTKQYASAFFGTSLASSLNTLGVDTLVIIGVSTSGCVRATALDAMQHGFRPMVVGSACGDRSPEIHNANMFDLNAKYADAVTEEEAIEKLCAGWK